jgi:hypothetical protein
MDLPVHNPAEPMTGDAEVSHIQHTRQYQLLSGRPPTGCQPQKFTEILMQLENGFRIPIDHAATLQHIQWQLQQGNLTVRLTLSLFGT